MLRRPGSNGSGGADGRIGEGSQLAGGELRFEGTLRIEGSNPGATVHIDAPEGEAACRIPCSLILAPGRHRVFTTLEGYATSEQDVDVVARSTVTARVRMQPLTGLSSRCTMPGRMGSSPTFLTLGNSFSSQSTTVAPWTPGPPCTAMPAGLAMTM